MTRTSRVALSLCALMLVAGCPSATPPPPPAGPDPVEVERKALQEKIPALAKEAEALLRDQDELIWKNWTEGVVADIARTYEGRERLFSVDNIKALDRLRALTADPTEKLALQNLHGHFVGEHLARELSEVTDAIANLEVSLTFQFEGKDVHYRDLERLLANERSAERRKALYEAATPAVQRIAQSWERKDERVEELLEALGVSSYQAYATQLRQADLERLAILATQVLDVTDEAWKTVLAQLARMELQLELAAVTRADFPRLFRAHNVDAFFPKESGWPRARQMLQGLSVKVGSLRVDDAERKGKNARALALPVVVPSDVRLSVRALAGARAQGQLFHELGHALHYGNTDARLKFELAKLGNDTVAEAVGYLFEDLLEDPVWLEQVAGIAPDKAREYLWTQSGHKLFVLRRAAGRILYELALHGPGAPDARATYGALMSRAYGVPVAGADLERSGTEREDFIESADDFRAMFLAGQIQGQLKARFGPSWWNNAESGVFLQKVWARGNAASAREAAQAMGDDRIKPDVLLLRISAALGMPITLPAAAPDVDRPAQR